MHNSKILCALPVSGIFAPGENKSLTSKSTSPLYPVAVPDSLFALFAAAIMSSPTPDLWVSAGRNPETYRENVA